MNVRRVNFTLRAVAAACLVVAVAALIWAWASPPVDETNSASVDVLAPSNVAASQPAGRLPPLEQFAGVWSKRLRQALAPASQPSDVATAAQPKAGPRVRPVEPPPLPYTLVGTIGQSVAFLRSTDGSIQACVVGDGLGGATVLAIRSAEVDLAVSGRTVTLRKLTSDEDADPLAPLPRDEVVNPDAACASASG